MEHNDLVVWADLLQVSVTRSSTQLAWVNQANQGANSNPNSNSYHHPSNSYLDRSGTPDREAWEEIHRLEEVANQWNRKSQHNQAPRGRPLVCGTPQFSPIAGRPQYQYARYNHNDRWYPHNRYNYRPEVSYNESGESMATMAVAEALNKLTENFEKMQKQPLAQAALSTIDWFDGTDKSNTMSWLEQVEVVAERNNQTQMEVGMAKLKGAPLHDIHKIHDLTWPCLHKLVNRKLLRHPLCIWHNGSLQ